MSYLCTVQQTNGVLLKYMVCQLPSGPTEKQKMTREEFQIWDFETFKHQLDNFTCETAHLMIAPLIIRNLFTPTIF